MSSRLLPAAAAAVLLLSGAPAFAQQATATAPAPAPQTAPAPDAEDEVQSPDEAAIEAAGEAFGTRMETMQTEMQNVLTAVGGDAAKAKADLDAIQVRYQPDADAFAQTLTAFLRARMAQLPTQPTAEDQAKLDEFGPTLRGIPAQVRSQLEQQTAAPQSTPPAR